MPEPLLQINDLSVGFDTGRGLVRPVNESNLTVFPGQTTALVGESGCGKSVSAMSILRLLPSPPARMLGGEIRFDGRDLLPLSERDMQRIRGRDIAMIFQEPMTSLNPVYTIGDQITEAVLLHQSVGRREAMQICERTLREVGINDPARRMTEYPHQLSGGMRQRIMIAMALSCQPRLLIADEPTTALDVTIQAQILDLLRKLQQETGMAILLITHDLGVVAEFSDTVAVMYASRIVETATVEELFDRPLHPYTHGLLRSVPKFGARNVRLETIPGAVPNPANFPRGCKFHTRCPLTRELAGSAPAGDVVTVRTGDETFSVLKTCFDVEPQLREIAPQHWAACSQIDGYADAPITRPTIDHKREVYQETIHEHEGADVADDLNAKAAR